MAELDRAMRGFELIVVPPTPKDKGMTYFQSCFAPEPKGAPMINGGLYQTAFQGKLESLGRKRKASLWREKGGETNQITERRRPMIKRLALLCCILLLPTIAAAATVEGTTNYGDAWIGGQVGGLFADHTEPAVTAGAIVGYNFCMSYRPAWQRYFGVALDFSWNKYNQRYFPDVKIKGDQFGLSFLARLQYPLMGDENFTRGRLVPFLMAGPAIVWTQRDNAFHAGDSTDIAVVAEIGLEYFVIPQLSIGPSFRFRHVWLEHGRDQYIVLGRLAYHF